MTYPIYRIACGKNDNSLELTRETLGAKAFNLLGMAQMKLPVPPAFVLGTQFTTDPQLARVAGLPQTWQSALEQLQIASGKTLGDSRNPLLLSVRSGAPISMPGMMETLLNIGLCDNTLEGFIRQTGNPRLAWDCYRRLIANFGEVVDGIDPQLFEQPLERLCNKIDERQLDFAALRDLSQQYLELYQTVAQRPFPQSPQRQLQCAIEAVIQSWHAAKAKHYRQSNHISEDLGTAVTVQAMVFGNSGAHAGAGVGFTRNPTTGDKVPWIDFLLNAQGEDVVSGRRNARGSDDLARWFPKPWHDLQEAMRRLEHHFKDMQDIEFTIDNGQLALLQTRSGKRTHFAAAQLALDFADEGIITLDEAWQRLEKLPKDCLIRRRVSDQLGQQHNPITTADTASTGVASGKLCLSEAKAIYFKQKGENVILVRPDAETKDIKALEIAEGLLTQRGARTSHAAVVARHLGKVCLVGAQKTQIIEESGKVIINDREFLEGDALTLDGNTGNIYSGILETVEEPDPLLTERINQLKLKRQPTH